MVEDEREAEVEDVGRAADQIVQRADTGGSARGDLGRVERCEGARGGKQSRRNG